jgi:vacuolar-type H+-ATPase subunit F/Vma7
MFNVLFMVDQDFIINKVNEAKENRKRVETSDAAEIILISKDSLKEIKEADYESHKYFIVHIGNEIGSKGRTMHLLKTSADL